MIYVSFVHSLFNYSIEIGNYSIEIYNRSILYIIIIISSQTTVQKSINLDHSVNQNQNESECNISGQIRFHLWLN